METEPDADAENVNLENSQAPFDHLKRHAYLSEPMNIPFTESYQKWQKGVEQNLKTQNGKVFDRPQINNTSKQLIEEKRKL